MEDYKDKLSSFSNRIKNEKIEVPIQKVKPLTDFEKETVVQLNVELPKLLIKKLKSRCLEHDLKIKDFIALAIENELKRN